MPPVSAANRAEERLPYGVASIGRQIQSLGAAGRLFLLDPEDPILSKITQVDPFRVYQRMGITDTAVGAAWGQIVSCLLGYGLDLLPASSRLGYGKEPSRAQKRAHRMVQAALDTVPMWWTVKERVLDANAWGWRPFEITYSRDLYVMGSRYWRPNAIRDKEPHHFRFNVNKELVYVAAGGTIVFDQPDDPARMWVCQSGSTDCPYGLAMFQLAWLPSYLKSQFFKLWQRGVNRAGGVPILKQGMGAARKLTNPGEANDPRQAISEVMSQAREVFRVLDEHGILVQMAGLEISFEKGLVASADTYEGPLKYLDQAIRSVLVLQDLTQSSAKDSSSRAAGEVARKILIDRARQVCGAFVENLNRLALMLCTLNFGDSFDKQDAPYFRSQIERVLNMEAAKAFFEMGAILDGNQLAENAGVPLAKAEDAGALQKAAAPASVPTPAADQAQGDPQNAGDAATGDQDAAGT